MKVILTEDVMGVGEIGQTVAVRPGYARNYLIPRGFALEVGSKSVASLKHKMWQIESKMRRLKVSAEDLAGRISKVDLTFELQVGSGGKVFGSVGGRDITQRLLAEGIEIDRRRVLLHEPIKKLGTHHVKVKLHPQVEAQLTVTVNEKQATADQENAETDEAKQLLEANAAGRKGRRGKKAATEVQEQLEAQDDSATEE